MGPRSENRGYLPISGLQPPGCSCFNGSTVREPWLSAGPVVGRWRDEGFNGSTVREPWLSLAAPFERWTGMGFNGSTVREPWLSSHCQRGVTCGSHSPASMGPRSENRGYRLEHAVGFAFPAGASMGPRSENRGYPDAFGNATSFATVLQWVHGPRTVVILLHQTTAAGRFVASMGPRSENRGYRSSAPACARASWSLQWVHGPRTVVIWSCQAAGPARHLCFNGSTVREPWLSIR